MLAAIEAFNRLSALEQRLFADHLARIMAAGEPVPAFAGLREEARDWAAWASLQELQAYAVAIVQALPQPEVRGLREALQRHEQGRMA